MRAARWCTLVCLFLCFAIVGTAIAQDAQELADRGCNEYMEARFDTAIQTLEGVLADGALGASATENARVCLARAYVKSGREADAKESFKQVLEANPKWRPSPFEVPPDEIAVFEGALADYQAAQPAPSLTPPPSAPVPTPAKTPKPPVSHAASDDDGGGIFSQWWFYALVGGAAVGAIALAGGGGDDGGGGTVVNDPLPEFPGTP